ncbi:MAG: hypothetical protein QMD78_04015, partial [Methanocellales archaeon]|nr:hypothetical protein [Methanocellales archaeon]
MVIGIDDVHPESSRDGLDFGGDTDEGVLGLLLNWIERHPHVKITLFVTPNWQLKSQNVPYIHFIKRTFQNNFIGTLATFLVRKWPPDKFTISDEKYLEWCNFMRAQVVDNKFSLGIHGYSHYNPNYIAQEFEHLSDDETEYRVMEALRLFSR